jgi:hypothetical protein
VRVLRESSANFAGRLDFVFQLCLARKPDAREREWLTEYYEKQKQLLEKEPNSANTIFPVEIPGVTSVEAAAWAGLCSVLLNLDEFITKE